MQNDKFTEFKKDLKRLLKKYNALILLEELGNEVICEVYFRNYSENGHGLISTKSIVRFIDNYCVCYAKKCECKNWE